MRKPNPAPPAPLSSAAFHALFAMVRNWGRWGSDDERGTLNHLTIARRQAAVRGSSGTATIGLAHTLSSLAGPTNPYPIVHGTSPAVDERMADGTPYGRLIEFIGMRPHGHTITHLDALCHASLDGSMYNGTAVGDSPLPGRGTVGVMRDGVVARGVLLDVPGSLGLDWLEPGHAVTRELAEYAEEVQGVRVGAGDVLLLRTGRRARELKLGGWNTREQLAGCDPHLMPWLREREVALLAGDGVSETYRSPVAGMRTPIHSLALVAMGLPLIDNCAMEWLARACADRSRWDFLFVMAPFDYPGGSSSPVNPLAIL